jgi:hypothetical protein
MDEQAAVTTDIESIPQPGAPSPAPSSLEAAVQARRASLQAEQSVHLPVPSWNGRLVAEYRGLEWKELRGEIQDRSEASINETTTAANSLLRASVDVYFIEDDRTKRSLGPWDEAYTQLGFRDGLTARQALMVPGMVFARDTQLMAHFAAFQEWQQGSDEEVDETIAGESVGPESAS